MLILLEGCVFEWSGVEWRAGVPIGVWVIERKERKKRKK